MATESNWRVVFDFGEDVMNDWAVGMSTGCFYETPIFDCLHAVSCAGFHLIEICSHPAHLDYHDTELVKRAADAIRESGLEPYSFHAPFADQIDIMSLDSATQEHAITEITQAVRAAAVLGVRYFVIHPGPETGVSPIDTQLQRMENAAAAINQIASHCRDLGMSIVLENMLPHLSFGRTRDLLWMLGAMQTTEVGICLDTGHAFLSGEIDTVVQRLSGHLWMIHASDNQGTFDDHAPPGDGKIRWRDLLERVDRSGFGGAIILELAGQGTIEKTMARIVQGRAFLRNISRRIALP
jgi:sugar phosphate isomerase/epimerase